MYDLGAHPGNIEEKVTRWRQDHNVRRTLHKTLADHLLTATLNLMTVAPPAAHPHAHETDRGHNDGCDCGFTIRRCEELCTRQAMAIGMCQCRREEREQG
jgi:hypothetical protein